MEPWTYCKSFVKEKKHHISDAQLNIIASIPDLFETFGEVIGASKCGPLARIEEHVMS